MTPMSLLDRYIGKAVALNVSIVMAVLLALFFFVGFVEEADKIGRGRYTALSAMEYTLLRLPQQAYELFPLGALLGAVLGLGGLASNSELIVMRAAGVSLTRIAGAVMKTGLLLMLLMFLIGEVLAPPVVQYATERRVMALSAQISLNTGQGLWARDGDTFINVRRVESDGRLVGIRLYTFDEAQRMRRLIHAGSARFRDGQWRLRQVRQTDFEEDRLVSRRFPELAWESLLSPQLVNVVAVKPQTLALWDLKQYVEYLHDNGLSAERHELAYWSKLVAPFTTGAMVFLAIPFVFGSLRSVPMGQRVLGGFLVGVAFYIINLIASRAGLVYALPPFLSASLPTLLTFLLAAWWLRRVR